MKRFILLLFVLLSVASTVSGAERQYQLLPGLSAIAQRMLDLGVTVPKKSMHPEPVQPDAPLPKAASREEHKG